jgi:hypothetical protein
MSQDEMYSREFSKDNAVVIERIHMIGATEHGEHVGLEIQTNDDKRSVLLVPYSLFQKLILGRMTAGGIAHREQLARLGSDNGAAQSRRLLVGA